MDSDRRNPPRTRWVFVHESLFLQVVLVDCLVSGDQELGLCCVEVHCLDYAFATREGLLSSHCSHLMDQHLGCRLDVVRHRCEIVSLLVPYDRLYYFVEFNLEGIRVLRV